MKHVRLMSYPEDEIALEKFLKMIKSLHLGMFAIPLFIGVTVYLIDDKITFDMIFDLHFIICTCVSFGILFLGNKLHRKFLSDAIITSKFQNKIMTYQMAIVAKYVSIEGAIILNLALTLFSNNSLFLISLISLIAYLIILRPTEEKVKAELRLF